MNSLFKKDECFYLTFLSVFLFLGSYFSADFFYYGFDVFGFKVLIHLLLLGNGLVVLNLAKRFNSSKVFPMLIALLYLASPTHLNEFIFIHHIQSLMAETMFLIGVTYYLNKDFNKSFGCLVVAAFLNFKFIALYPFYLMLVKTTKYQKTLVFIHVIVALIFIFPLLHENKPGFIFNFHTIAYVFESLILPQIRSIFDFSIIIPNYQNVYLIMLLMIFIFILLFKAFRNKSPLLNFVCVLLVSTVLSTFIPFKKVIDYEDYFYYAPGLYPLVLIGFLVLILFIGNKNLKVGIGLAGVLLSFWIWSNLSFQRQTSNELAHWTQSMSQLPYDYQYEEQIKLSYFKVLMKNNELEKAEAFANETRFKFPNETWYKILLRFAGNRNDKKALEKLFYEMGTDQVPYFDE